MRSRGWKRGKSLWMNYKTRFSCQIRYHFLYILRYPLMVRILHSNYYLTTEFLVNCGPSYTSFRPYTNFPAFRYFDNARMLKKKSKATLTSASTSLQGCTYYYKYDDKRGHHHVGIEIIASCIVICPDGDGRNESRSKEQSGIYPDPCKPILGPSLYQKNEGTQYQKRSLQYQRVQLLRYTAAT